MIEYTVKVNSDGTKFWYLNGRYHREDGPAVERPDGSCSWYLNGLRYSEREYLRKMNPVKKFTVKEICDLLGYEIEVVKE